MMDTLEFNGIKSVFVAREDTSLAERVVITAERIDGTRVTITLRRQGGEIRLEVE